jgi:hypothetical protein
MGWVANASAALPPGKIRYPLYRKLGGPQSLFGQVRKISSPPGFDPWTVQLVASRYTDCAIPPPGNNLIKNLNWSANEMLIYLYTCGWRRNLRSCKQNSFWSVVYKTFAIPGLSCGASVKIQMRVQTKVMKEIMLMHSNLNAGLSLTSLLFNSSDFPWNSYYTKWH